MRGAPWGKAPRRKGQRQWRSVLCTGTPAPPGSGSDSQRGSDPSTSMDESSVGQLSLSKTAACTEGSLHKKASSKTQIPLANVFTVNQMWKKLKMALLFWTTNVRIYWESKWAGSAGSHKQV